jgi:TusA-related sulfurtransferase
MECPMPIIQTRLKLNLLRKDDELLILADDATFHAEFARFCQLADIILLSARDCGEFKEYHIKLTQ